MTGSGKNSGKRSARSKTTAKRPPARKSAVKKTSTKRPPSKKATAKRPAAKRATRKKTIKAQRPLWKRVAFWGGVAACWGLVGVFAIIGVIALSLPNVEEIANETRRPSITLVTAEGREVAALGEQRVQ